jgi:hypothetical protein
VNAEKGMAEKDKNLQEYFRRHANIVHCSLSPKPSDIQKLWPIAGDEEVNEKKGGFNQRLLQRLEERRARLANEQKDIVS